LILRPADRRPIPEGAAVTIHPEAFPVERTVDPVFRGAGRVDRSDPTTWDILAVAAGTHPVGRRLDTPLQQP